MGRVGRASKAVSDVAITAMEAPPGVNTLLVTLESLRVVVGADTAGFYIHERDGWSTAVQISPDEVWSRIPFARLRTSFAEEIHPGIAHLMRPATVQPFEVTDLISERQWLSSALGSAMRPEWGRNFQLSIPVRGARKADAAWTWVLGKQDRDFSASDRDVAEALQPVLCVVARHEGSVSGLSTASGRLPTTLTQRELVVLGLLAEGMSATGAAHRLGVSPRTIHKHAERIYRKLGARDRYAAVRAAAELGLIADALKLPRDWSRRAAAIPS